MSMAKTKSKDPTKIKRRVWELQSQCMHDGKEIWTPEIVTKVIEKLEEEKLDNGKPALKRWAWCMHDKDKVLEENIDQLRLKDPTSTLKIGDPRPAHIHLALEFENAVYNTHLQKISGLPMSRQSLHRFPGVKSIFTLFQNIPGQVGRQKGRFPLGTLQTEIILQ